MCRGLAFDFQFDRCGAARVDHQREIERTICLRLESHDLLCDSLFGKLESALIEADYGFAFGIRDACEDADQVSLHAYGAFLALLLLWICRIGSCGVRKCAETREHEGAKRGNGSSHLRGGFFGGGIGW